MIKRVLVAAAALVGRRVIGKAARALLRRVLGR